MPLYTITTSKDVLSSDAKSALAMEITNFHSEMAGVNKTLVKIVFSTFSYGDAFVGGNAAPAAILTVLIRAGRSADYKRAMASQLWTILHNATGARDTAMLVIIQEAPPSQVMEMGQIMSDLVTGGGS